MNTTEQLMDALEVSKSYLTIVEGKNDKRALENFGFDNVRTLNKALFRVVEEIDKEEVIILTDLDKHGKQLYQYFFRECARRGIRVNNRVRQVLHATELRQIEGLVRYVERQQLEPFP